MCALGGCSRLTIGERLHVRMNPLTDFRYGYGGNMNGNSHDIFIKRVDDTHAIITCSDAEWHYQDPVVKEYLVSLDVLAELEDVFRKYGLIHWDNKTFSKMFVCDGESESYGFNFGGEPIGVAFSSQIYPMRYRKVLNKLHEVIDKYTNEEDLLPGLVLTTFEDEEEEMRWHWVAEGEVRLIATQYSRDCFYFTLLNGLAEDINFPERFQIFEKGASEPLINHESKYDRELCAKAGDSLEDYINIENRLEAGSYVLRVAGYECEFEIK